MEEKSKAKQSQQDSNPKSTTKNQLPREENSILITSFDVWKSHHITNASDDLLTEWASRNRLNQNTQLLRKLPVDFELAPKQVIAAINRLQPDVVVCCGMAEKRKRLSIESNGKFKDNITYTKIDVRKLVQGLSMTRVSHHAGKFVCNHTYYSVLNYIQITQRRIDCIFVHVPVLNSQNREAIVTDFSTILARLTHSNKR